MQDYVKCVKIYNDFVFPYKLRSTIAASFVELKNVQIARFEVERGLKKYMSIMQTPGQDTMMLPKILSCARFLSYTRTTGGDDNVFIVVALSPCGQYAVDITPEDALFRWDFKKLVKSPGFEYRFVEKKPMDAKNDIVVVDNDREPNIAI